MCKGARINGYVVIKRIVEQKWRTKSKTLLAYTTLFRSKQCMLKHHQIKCISFSCITAKQGMAKGYNMVRFNLTKYIRYCVCSDDTSPNPGSSFNPSNHFRGGSNSSMLEAEH